MHLDAFGQKVATLRDVNPLMQVTSPVGGHFNTMMELMTYKGLTPAQRLEHYRKDRRLIRKAQESQVSFLGSALKLRMGVTVIGGSTGRGKSTTSANILADFYKRYQQRQAVIITNEEVSADVLDRVSCILLNENFYRYRDGKFSEGQVDAIQHMSTTLTKRLEVVACRDVDMTCLEDVISVLEYAMGDSINLVLIDYLQTVTWSRERSDIGPYEVSKKLGLFLKDYGRRVTVPVVIFAQVQPLPPPQKSRQAQDAKPVDFANRVQGDKTFVNHAVMAIEILPNFELKQTIFYIHKDRFSSQQGQSLVYNWDCGQLLDQNLVVL